MSRGGGRKGAGRPPEGPIKDLHVGLSQAHHELLQELMAWWGFTRYRAALERAIEMAHDKEIK